jgi:hypothetical protein
MYRTASMHRMGGQLVDSGNLYKKIDEAFRLVSIEVTNAFANAKVSPRFSGQGSNLPGL